jgi:hypothetical protein
VADAISTANPGGAPLGEFRLSPEDDNFHSPDTKGWFEHETMWMWFAVPERKLGAWIYHYVRPNIGVSGGGVFLWDDTAWNHMETPYYLNYSNMPLPQPFDLRNTKFANGFGYQVLEPLQTYRWTYKDRDIINFDLQFDAFMKPWVIPRGDPPQARHLDQFGQVTGELMLHGERIKVDCLAMRDRSWSHIRPEPWKDGAGGGTYITGAASKELAFFGAGPGGFFLQDGVRSPLVSGRHERIRDPEHGFIKNIVVEGQDELGRSFVAEGEAVSRMGMPISGAHGVCWNSLVKYKINGVDAWGDDQDAWPLHQWSAMRRRQKGLHDVRADTTPRKGVFDV